jgi:signal peptidase II
MKVIPAHRGAFSIRRVSGHIPGPGEQGWAIRRLRFADRTVITGVLDFVYAEVPGLPLATAEAARSAAGSLWFSSRCGRRGLFYFFRTARNDDHIGACALLLAGILGNLTDRVRLGFVIDFIHLHAGQYHWPTFNVADASI